MFHQYVDLMGVTAAVMTTSAFFPQLIRSWRQGSEDLSFFMLALLISGTFLWLFYGIALNAMPIILANSATALQVFGILVLKLWKRSGRVEVR